MLSVSAFRRAVRASAIYDVLMTVLFVTPWTFLLLREHLNALNVGLAARRCPSSNRLHLLISSLIGSVVMVWSVLRMLDPAPRFGRYDAAARYLFSTWMAWALLVTGQPRCGCSSCRSWPGAWRRACRCAAQAREAGVANESLLR
jgi:hypothetical protein